MKLKNKISGEIKEFALFDGNELQGGATLESLTKEWEDVPEEPKKHYEILAMGAVMEREDAEDEIFRNQGQREIGNYFETREEAEQAVRKLKAWKRLMDKGFKFEGWQDLEACDEIERMVVNHIIDGENIIGFRMDDYHDCFGDLNICFGGENE